MSRDLENEVAVAPFIEKLAGGQRPDWQATQDERSRAEAQVLISFFAIASDQLDAFRSPKLPP
jgi:hypothetical protein